MKKDILENIEDSNKQIIDEVLIKYLGRKMDKLYREEH